MKTYQPLTGPTDPRVTAFLYAWHENGRDDFCRSYSNLDYDSPHNTKSAKAGRKYINLDCGTGGVMMVEKATGQVYRIKAYGVIHRGRPCGRIDELTSEYENACCCLPIEEK